MRRIICFIVIGMLFILVGCSNKSTGNIAKVSNVEENNSIEIPNYEYSEKVNSFRKETSKYASIKNELPKNIYDFNQKCISILKEILMSKESITASESVLLEGDSSYYLEFSGEREYNKNKFRFVEVGIKEPFDGDVNELIIQSWNDNMEVSIQELDTINFNASNIGSYLFYDFFLDNTGIYAVAISKMEGVEDIYLKLTIYEYDDMKWVPKDVINENSIIENWELEKWSDMEGVMNIYSYNEEKIDYGYKHINKSIKIYAFDENGNELDTLLLNLENGEWSITKTER